jgi:hypothetical protein
MTTAIMEKRREKESASLLCRFSLASPRVLLSRGTRPLWRQQLSSERVQVRQCKGREQPRTVLGQASIAHLGKAPQTPDHVKGVLAASTGDRAQTVDLTLMGTERGVAAGPAVDVVTHPPEPWRRCDASRSNRPGPHTTRVHPRAAGAQLTDVRGVSRGRHERVADTLRIRAHVCLHAEVPLSFILSALAHLRIARLGLVRGRGRRIDDRGIHDRAALEQQALLLEQASHRRSAR